MHQVALDLTLLRDIEHVAADVDADPLVSVLFERLATKPGAAPNVEDHARPALRQAEHLDGALSHLRLHVDHTRRVQVLARLCRVIEHLGRRYLLWPRHRAALAHADGGVVDAGRSYTSNLGEHEEATVMSLGSVTAAACSLRIYHALISHVRDPQAAVTSLLSHALESPSLLSHLNS